MEVLIFLLVWVAIGYAGGISRRAWYRKQSDVLRQSGFPSELSEKQLILDTLFGPFTIIIRLRNGTWQ